MDVLLDRWEKNKKDKYGNHFHDQHKHFSPFVLSDDGMLGGESLYVLTNLIQLMAEKMDELISHVQVWINNLITTTVARY